MNKIKEVNTQYSKLIDFLQDATSDELKQAIKDGADVFRDDYNVDGFSAIYYLADALSFTTGRTYEQSIKRIINLEVLTSNTNFIQLGIDEIKRVIECFSDSIDVFKTEIDKHLQSDYSDVINNIRQNLLLRLCESYGVSSETLVAYKDFYTKLINCNDKSIIELYEIIKSIDSVREVKSFTIPDIE